MSSSREAMLYDHLAHNFYPPMTHMHSVAQAAIDGDTDEQGFIPAPMLGAGAYVYVDEVIRNLRLEFFTDNSEEAAEEEEMTWVG